MKASELIEALKKIKPDEKITFRFYEGLTEKTFDADAIEIKNNAILLHGNISAILHQPINKQQEFIIKTVVYNIEECGEIDDAIRNMERLS